MNKKVVILEEFKLRRDLSEVQEIIKRADYLISIGLEIPQKDIDDLLLWEDELEQGDIKRRQLFVQYGSFSSTEQPRAFKVANSMRDVDETSRAQILFESKDLGG